MRNTQTQNDAIWKALGDSTRREILDGLAKRPQTTGEIVARFGGLCRTNVMKHLGVLVDANLVIVRREGRVRWNYLNPVPIQRVCDRWVSNHVSGMASAMSRIKDYVEEREARQPKQSRMANRKSRLKSESENQKPGKARTNQ